MEFTDTNSGVKNASEALWLIDHDAIEMPSKQTQNQSHQH